jgi:hypothetical protein
MGLITPSEFTSFNQKFQRGHARFETPLLYGLVAGMRGASEPGLEDMFETAKGDEAEWRWVHGEGYGENTMFFLFPWARADI